MLNRIVVEPQTTPQTRIYIQKEQPQPKYFCGSCNNLLNGNYCDCFQRHVVKDFNRCFNHSNYKPIAGKFKVPENLDEIIEREEQIA